MSITQRDEKTPQSIDHAIKQLEIEKSLLLNDYLTSKDPEAIIKAQSYLTNLKNGKADAKAYFFPFDAEYNNGREYKDVIQTVPDHILRRVSYIHIVDLIINTKINQIRDFLKFTVDDQREGFTRRKKLSRCQDRYQEKEPSKKEQKDIEALVDFIEHSGQHSKWDIYDDLYDFVGKIVRDSFIFNRLSF